ncbi:MAG: cytochrome c oxidase subunit II [Salibacteraceae bacterium]|nr:cytochrome c oxidase subunit II [Salibacteraceae bacterium]|tara:strand:- start:28670 stop:29824 length:1155 start_codon:yes stop_codon:yes gene_type:complete
MTALLFSLVIIVGIVSIVQMLRVFDLSNALKGTDEIQVNDQETNNIRWAFVVFFLGFFAFFIYLVASYGDQLLPQSASLHGLEYDWLMDLNMIIIITAAGLTHILLMVFIFKYAKNVSPKATFVTHNNRLELIWTTTPAVVLTIIVIYGISAWNSMLMDKPEDSINIELYARQFDWTARYAGEDNQLGKANFRMISTTNALGVINSSSIDDRLNEYDDKIFELEASREKVFPGGVSDDEILDNIILVKKNRAAVLQYEEQSKNENFDIANDDIITKVEFHIPVNKSVNFSIRSQDVLHSAYMPHFRAQMNAVPGVITHFYFTPIITTKEMKKITGNPDFDYLLLCNKICGAAHYNMQMNIIVETEEEYNKWLAEQPKFNVAQAQ